MTLSKEELETFLWEQPRACEARGLAAWQAFFALGRRYRHLSLGPYGVAQQVSVRFSSASNCYHVQLLHSSTGTIGPGTYFKAKAQLFALTQLLEQATRADEEEANIYSHCVLIGQKIALTGDFILALNLDEECKLFTYSHQATGIHFQPVCKGWSRPLSKEQQAAQHELANDLLAERADALAISQAERTDALADVTATARDLATLVVTPTGVLRNQPIA